MSATDTQLANESVDLLSQLIRNECVNDGTPESGHESRSVDLLAQYLGDSGLELERYVAQPGRENLVARIEGSDPTAPTLLLMGHTDVVPANPDGWRRNPFGGEVVDGEVWGRGAVDMLNLTATMAVAFRALARSGFRPRGIPAAYADPRDVAAVHRGRRLRARMERESARRSDARRLLRRAADRLGASSARVHAHDVRADGNPRWHEDECDSRSGGGRGRHPYASGPAQRRHPRDARRRARRPRRVHGD